MADGDDWRGLFDALPRRTVARTRGDCGFHTLRCWSAGGKSAQIAAFKALKLAPPKPFVRAAASEIATFMTRAFGPAKNFVVTAVPCGHSKSDKCLSALLAVAAARASGATYVKVWRDRPRSGSSFPRPASERPRLEWIAQPRTPVVVVDDVATSGSHMEECLAELRAMGVPALGVAWIGGEAAGLEEGCDPPARAAVKVRAKKRVEAPLAPPEAVVARAIVRTRAPRAVRMAAPVPTPVMVAVRFDPPAPAASAVREAAAPFAAAPETAVRETAAGFAPAPVASRPQGVGYPFPSARPRRVALLSID